jgi:hypothetical protein
MWDLLHADQRECIQFAERFADGLETEAPKDYVTRRMRGLAFPWPMSDQQHHITHAVCGAMEEGRNTIASTMNWAAYVHGSDINCELFRDIFGNPFRPVALSPAWRTDTAVSLAGQMYESRDFSAMPILADALQDAGCDNEHILAHCRGPGPHVRGCWVIDLVLGKE